jgi:hypothetical protein
MALPPTKEAWSPALSPQPRAIKMLLLPQWIWRAEHEAQEYFPKVLRFNLPSWVLDLLRSHHPFLCSDILILEWNYLSYAYLIIVTCLSSWAHNRKGILPWDEMYLLNFPIPDLEDIYMRL